MRTWIRFFAWVAAIVGAGGLVMRLLFFDVWRVPVDDPLLAASIEPTLSAGDLVVVMRHTSVSRGELLRCTDPESPSRFVVARAIGRQGEHIELHDEVVSLDGKRNPSPRACDPPAVIVHDPRNDDDAALSCSQEDFGDMSFPVLRARERPEAPTKATVEATRWFLVSDDRHIHLDSRDYGQIDPETCQHVVFRLLGVRGFADSRRRLTIIW